MQTQDSRASTGKQTAMHGEARGNPSLPPKNSGFSREHARGRQQQTLGTPGRHATRGIITDRRPAQQLALPRAPSKPSVRTSAGARRRAIRFFLGAASFYAELTSGKHPGQRRGVCGSICAKMQRRASTRRFTGLTWLTGRVVEKKKSRGWRSPQALA